MDGPSLYHGAFFEDATQEERERPPFWRYWRTLPTRGQMAIYSREWTLGAVVDRAVGKIDEVGLDRRIRHIQNFEKAVSDDGALILKFWLHLPKKALKSGWTERRRTEGVRGGSRKETGAFTSFTTMCARCLSRWCAARAAAPRSGTSF